MKALRCRAWGAPDTLQLEEAESPVYSIAVGRPEVVVSRSRTIRL
jgi:hypothetical protein